MFFTELFEKIKLFFQRLGFLKPATQDQATQTVEEEMVAPTTESVEEPPPQPVEEQLASGEEPLEPVAEDNPIVPPNEDNYEFVDEQSLKGHPIYQNSLASEPQ